MQAAYDILSDAEKRQAYDRYGAAGQRGSASARAAPLEDVDLGDLLGHPRASGLRRAARRQTAPERGADLESRVRISFEDALLGVQVRVPVEIETACHVCGARRRAGHRAPHPPRLRRERRHLGQPGPLRALAPVPALPREWRHRRHAVQELPRVGSERVTRRYQVKVPAGAKDGTRIRLKGKGEPGQNGGPAGDLFVRVQVDPSPLYERRGADLVLDVPVTYPEAALGATVQIPTPDGPVALKVPSGSENGKLLRVKGRGAPKLNGGGKGDLLARLRVTVPGKLTSRSAKRSRRTSASPASSRVSASRGAVGAMPDRPRYMISVAAELADCIRRRCGCTRTAAHPAGATPGGTRLYSENDVERLRSCSA